MKLRACIIDCRHQALEGKTWIELVGKTKDGKTVLIIDDSPKPYFYVEDNSRVRKKLDKLGVEYRKVKRRLGLENKNVLKVTVDVPSQVQEVSEKLHGFKRYGIDISFYKLYLMDKGVYPLEWVEVEGNEVGKEGKFDKILKAKKIQPLTIFKKPLLRILAFDLEVYEKLDKKEIMMVSLVGKDYRKVITTGKIRMKEALIVKSEKELLERFVEEVEKYNPDFIVGYNTDGFDFPVLREKFDEYRLDLTIGRDEKPMRFVRKARASAAKLFGRIHLDLYQFISRILAAQMKSEVLTLEAVSQELIGKGKKEVSWFDIYESWADKKDLARIADYNLNDSVITLELAEFLLPQIFELSRVVGQLPFDTCRSAYSQLVEWYFIRKAVEEGILVPRRPTFDVIRKRLGQPRYVGGFVKEPIPGIHKNVAVIDYRSMYPSLIVSYNIDPSTLNCKCCKKEKNVIPGKNYWFCKKRKGFIPSKLKELLEKRWKVKKQLKKKFSEDLKNRDSSLKTIANATYGSFAFSGARWYCYQCAEASATLGRMWVQKVMKKAEKSGLKVLYGDTDSLMVTGKGINSFVKAANKMLPGIMELELQGTFPRGLFVATRAGKGAKKRYVLLDKNGRLTIRGFEKVRKDWCQLAKDTQEEVMRIVLKENKPQKALDYVRRIVAKIKAGKVDLELLAVYTQLTRPLSEYKVISPHTVAARKLQAKGFAVSPGMSILYIITKGKGSISERAEPFNYAKSYDPDYYINNQIIPAALRILQVFGVKGEDFFKKESLKEFVK